LLHVTPEIERRNVTIIGREERKRRQRERAERVRREDGVLDIKTYKLKRQEDAEASGERAKALRAEGKNIADIARVLGKSVETVRSYLYRE
jgi:DNA-binding NarL/FixJ family response regulator